MSATSDKIHIQLMIGNEMHPITIRPEMEETFRAAAKSINEKLGRYRQSYPNLSYNRCMAITMLDFAVYAIHAEKEADRAPILDIVTALTAEVEQALASKTDKDKA